MIIVAVKFVPKTEKVSEFLEVFNVLAPVVKEERGCVEYKLHKDLDKDEYFLFEQWESKQDLDAHLQTEHMKTFFAKREDFFSLAPDINIYNVTN